MGIQLTRTGFAKWLKENNRKGVGVPSDANHCPLCNFLKSQGANDVEVQIEHRVVDGRKTLNTSWQRYFQNHSMQNMWKNPSHKIRGTAALKILNALPR